MVQAIAANCLERHDKRGNKHDYHNAGEDDRQCALDKGVPDNVAELIGRLRRAECCLAGCFGRGVPKMLSPIPQVGI